MVDRKKAESHRNILGWVIPKSVIHRQPEPRTTQTGTSKEEPRKQAFRASTGAFGSTKEFHWIPRSSCTEESGLIGLNRSTDSSHTEGSQAVTDKPLSSFI